MKQKNDEAQKLSEALDAALNAAEKASDAPVSLDEFLFVENKPAEPEQPAQNKAAPEGQPTSVSEAEPASAPAEPGKPAQNKAEIEEKPTSAAEAEPEAAE